MADLSCGGGRFGRRRGHMARRSHAAPWSAIHVRLAADKYANVGEARNCSKIKAKPLTVMSTINIALPLPDRFSRRHQCADAGDSAHLIMCMQSHAVYIESRLAVCRARKADMFATPTPR